MAIFSAESINYGHSALHGPAAHIQRYGYGATQHSAEKNGDTRRKVALFIARAHVFFARIDQIWKKSFKHVVTKISL